MTTQPTAQAADIHPENPIAAAAVSSSVLFNMLVGAAATVNSDWFQYQPFKKCAIEITGSGATFSLQMVGSLSNESPTLSGETGSDIGSAITTLGMTFEDFSGVRWVQAQLTGPDTGTLNVDLSAVAP